MCSKKVKVNEEYQKMFGIEYEYKGTGCTYCNNSGFYGRVGLFEINKVTERTKAAIFSYQNNQNIENCLLDFNEGIECSISGHAKYLIENGIVPCQEVLPCF